MSSCVILTPYFQVVTQSGTWVWTFEETLVLEVETRCFFCIGDSNKCPSEYWTVNPKVEFNWVSGK